MSDPLAWRRAAFVSVCAWLALCLGGCAQWRTHLKKSKAEAKAWHKVAPVLDWPPSCFGTLPNDPALFACGKEGRLFRSDDGGAHWTTLKTGTQEKFYSLFGSPSGALYASGSRGRILRSIDRGEHWQVLETDTEGSLFMIWGLPDTTLKPASEEPSSPSERLFALGQSGTLLISDDGLRWRSRSLDSPGPLYGIWGPDLSLLYIVGSRGVWRSTDRGESWEHLFFPSSAELYSIWGDSNGIYIGGDSALFYSEDGESFSQKITSIGPTLVWGNKDAVYAGSAYSLQRSYTKGRSWETLWQSTSDAIASLGFSEQGKPYFATLRGFLYTLTKNKKPNMRYFDTSSTDLCAASIGGRGIFVGGTSDLLLFSKDARSFLPQAEPATQRFRCGLWHAPNGDLFTVSTGGLIERWREGSPEISYAGLDPLYAIAGSPAVGLVAVGSDGLILHRRSDDSPWEESALPEEVKTDLYTVAITPDGTIYAAGDAPWLAVSRDNCATWERLNLPSHALSSGTSVHALWVEPGGTLWVGGKIIEASLTALLQKEASVLWRLPRGKDSLSEDDLVTLDTGAVTSIWRSSGGVFYVATGEGLYSSYDGENWAREITGEITVVTGGQGRILAFGKRGAVWELR